MSLRVHVLASGSSGNATLYSTGGTHVLVDCGLSARVVTALLRLAGVEPEELSAVFVTHEHTDHIKGLPVFLKRRRIPLFIAPECLESPALAGSSFWGVEPLEAGRGIRLGRLAVIPFRVPHDAACCYGFAFEADGVRAVQATDLGQPTPAVRRELEGAHCVLLEFNHDVDRLMEGPYPMHIKLRVRSALGHLSNEQAAGLLAETSNGSTQALYLMHLSRENNLPALAHLAAQEALAGRRVRVGVTRHLQPAPPWEG